MVCCPTFRATKVKTACGSLAHSAPRVPSLIHVFVGPVKALDALTRPTRTVLPAASRLKIKAPPCHLAGDISRQTRFANIWSHGVDRARRRNADVSYERGTAIAIASHPTTLVIHVYTGNLTKAKLAFQ
jgi:hypothetical protein